MRYDRKIYKRVSPRIHGVKNMTRISEEKMGELKEIAELLLESARPSFIDYRYPEGEIEARSKYEASIRFVSTIWGTPVSLTLYASLTLGLKCPNILYSYRKSGKKSIYRVHLKCHKDEYNITPFWDIEVERVRRGEEKTYYCKLVDYGVVVYSIEQLPPRPIVKL